MSTKARKITHASCSTQKYQNVAKESFYPAEIWCAMIIVCNGATKKVHFVHQRNHNQFQISLECFEWVTILCVYYY